jgi:hypothetical protein
LEGGRKVLERYLKRAAVVSQGAEYVYETILKPQFQNFKHFLGTAPALEFVKPPKEEKKADGEGNDTSAVKDQVLLRHHSRAAPVS